MYAYVCNNVAYLLKGRCNKVSLSETYSNNFALKWKNSLRTHDYTPEATRYFFFQKCQGTNGSLATNNKLNKFTWRVRTGNANIYRSIVNCNTFRVKLPTSWSIIFSEMTSSWNVAVPFTGRGQMNKNNNKNRSVNDAPSLWVGRWTNQRHLTVYTEARATDGN